MTLRTRTWAARAAAPLLALSLLAGCGDDGGGAEPLDAANPDASGCAAWTAASPEERARFIRDLGYPEQTDTVTDVVPLLVEATDAWCAGPGADEEFGLGGAISGAALACCPGAQPEP